MTREEELIKNVQFVESALCAACQKAGRNPQDVSLMAVTKYAQDKDVLTLLDSGLIRHIGESRVQQAEKRWTSSVFAKPLNILSVIYKKIRRQRPRGCLIL